MKTAYRTFLGSLGFLLLSCALVVPAEGPVVFGLRHTPLGGATIDTSYGGVYVYPGESGQEEAPGDFGVSVALGEADCGIWGRIGTSGSLQQMGAFLEGYAFGQVNGAPEEQLSVLRVESLDVYGPYEVRADFSALGSTTFSYEVYSGDKLVASANNQSGSALIYTTGETGPRANPFWLKPDGSVAAVVEFSSNVGILLPNGGEEGTVSGDKLIIHAEGVLVLVDFTSRVDLWAGGGESHIEVWEERLGVFERAHKSLGEVQMQALGGALSVTRLDAGQMGEEVGVSVDLKGSRRFSMEYLPVDLVNEGATILASAVGNRSGQTGEFLGWAGVQQQSGTVQALADFSAFTDRLQVGVYQNNTLVGSARWGGANVRVTLAGNPRVVSLGAAADRGAMGAGFAIRFEEPVTFVLADHLNAAGDEIRFEAVNASHVESLSAFSVTWSNLIAVTITGESRPGAYELLDYFPEVWVPAFAKVFSGSEGGEVVTYTRLAGRTNVGGTEIVIVTDRYSETNAVSASYSLQEDGLFFHGYTEGSADVFSAAGVRLLPEQLSVGRSYFSMGTFERRDASGTSHTVEASCITRVAGTRVGEAPGISNLPGLQVETAITFEQSGGPGITRYYTNVLAQGVGVVKFSEREVAGDETVRTRSGEVVNYAILETPVRTSTVNIGANTILRVEVRTPSSPWIEWRRNGEALSQAGFDRTALAVNTISEASAGTYSIRVGLGENQAVLTSDVAVLRVIPFSDTPPFWATCIGGGWGLHASAVKTDSAGNVYMAGTFQGTLTWGSNYVSRGAEDVYIMKVVPSGEIAWIRTAGGNNYEAVQSLATDASGNVYVAGTFYGAAQFGSVTLVSQTRLDPMFVTKLDSNGNFLWAVASGGSGNSFCSSMTMDSAGNMYVMGGFHVGTAVFGSTTLTNEHYYCDLFLTKLNNQGQFLWAKQISDETPGVEGGNAVSGYSLLADSGSVYLAGVFGEQISFGSITLRANSPPYYDHGFLVKANPEGEFQWGKVVGNSAYKLTADTFGDIYVGGSFHDLCRIDGVLLAARNFGGSDAYLAKFGADGRLGWANLCPHGDAYSMSMVGDTLNNLYVAGSFYREAAYGSTIFTQPNYGSSTVLSKLDSQGRTVWHKQIAGSGDNWPQALGRDDSGNVYLAGNFRNQVTFGNYALSSSSLDNAYLVKITGATPPTITGQPESHTVNLGQSATMTVSVSGSEPLSYQWRRNDQDLAGANSATYSIQSASHADAGSYSVLVKNGGGIAYSSNAVLQVVVPDAGTVALAGNSFTTGESNGWLAVSVIRTGSTSAVALVGFVTRSGTATGGEDYGDTVVKVQFAPGETEKTVVVPIVDDLMYEPTENFSLRLTEAGAGVMIGEPATATVALQDNDTVGAPFIRMQPSPRVVMTGKPTSFSVLAEGAPPLTYEWRKDGTVLVSGINHYITIPAVQISDAGEYSVVIRNEVGEVTSESALLTVVAVPDVHYVMFGLTNRPLGSALVRTNSGALEISPRGTWDQEVSPPVFGVSINLGEADSGAVGYLSTSSSFQDAGHWTAGRVYGQVNGVPGQLLCSLKATSVEWYGRYEIKADFAPLAPASVTYQIFNAGKLVGMASGAGPLTLYDMNEMAPSANPFWRLPDGTIAAVVQLSATRAMTLDGGESTIYGDRIIIRAENTKKEVDFASRIDVTAGGGEDSIYITQERLGMFKNSHLALGDAVLKAVGGRLTVAGLHAGNGVSREIGTSVALEDTHQFRMQLAPQELATDGASITASAVATEHGRGGEFLGGITLRNSGGMMQLKGEMPISSGMQVLVYSHGAMVGSVRLTEHSTSVALSGSPQVTHFDAAANNPLSPPWFGAQLDRSTVFTLPGGSALEGDQLRFRAMAGVSLDHLHAFSLTASNVAEFTIISEATQQGLGVAEFLTDILATASIKKFVASGEPAVFARATSRTNLVNGAQVAVQDWVGATVTMSDYYSTDNDGLRWHGRRWGSQSLLSELPIRLLPEEVSLGQTYASGGTMLWRNETTGEEALLEANGTTTLGWEVLNSPLAANALRVETRFVFSGGNVPGVPTSFSRTNWLAFDLGEIKFAESLVAQSGQVEARSGELTDGAVLKSPVKAYTANVGASIVMPVEVITVGSGEISEWLRNGTSLGTGSTVRLYVDPVTSSDAGSYAVKLAIASETGAEFRGIAEVATLRVVPFSDTPPFWAAQMSGSSRISGQQDCRRPGWKYLRGG